MTLPPGGPLRSSNTDLRVKYSSALHSPTAITMAAMFCQELESSMISIYRKWQFELDCDMGFNGDSGSRETTDPRLSAGSAEAQPVPIDNLRPEHC
jgi:hypothetical protein